MSLCAVLNNNQDKYVIIAGDGRLVYKNSHKLVDNSFKKIYQLSDHSLVFISGIQYLCDELKNTIFKENVKEMNLDELISKISKESLNIHNNFIKTTNYELIGNETTMAIILAFYDKGTNESGFVNFCHSNEFRPVITLASEMNCRGIGSSILQDYILENFNKNNIEDVIFNGYQKVAKQTILVGGKITIYRIDKNGIFLLKEGYCNE